ncbi:hypothetical protein J4G37_18615 [Microvirga sp. 3-52]|nr:hypothetical protein [Microvirga sp. 3-52]
MAGLVPAISIRRALRLSHRDHRHKAGDDVVEVGERPRLFQRFPSSSRISTPAVMAGTGPAIPIGRARRFNQSGSPARGR